MKMISKIIIVTIIIILIVLFIIFLMCLSFTREAPVLEKLNINSQLIDTIEIQKGNTGKVSVIEDENYISKIIANINKVKIVYLNRLQREGFGYKISFYQGQKRLMSIWTHGSKLSTNGGKVYKVIGGNYNLEMFEMFLEELLEK